MSKKIKETAQERMWRQGRVPNAQILKMVEHFVADDGMTERQLEEEIGVSPEYFRTVRSRGSKTMDFKLADKILAVIDCTTRWWDEDLVEHYLNVNLSVPDPKPKKPGLCMLASCFNKRSDTHNFCSDEHREVYMVRRREYRRELAARKRAEAEQA